MAWHDLCHATGTFFAWWLVCLAPAVLCANPFSATLSSNTVTLHVPAQHYLYADSVKITQAETPLTFTFAPAPIDYDDPLLGPITVLRADTTLTFTNSAASPVTVTYQGCSDAGICYLPQRVTFGETSLPSTLSPPQFPRRAVGYLSATELLAFLDDTAAPPSRYRRFINSPVEFFKQYGVVWLILFTLAGGFLLNLTPCVLPLIPVNLGLIGVGASHTTRRRGLLLGAAYALGTALAYASLGVVVLLTRAVFGTLQSSPWFNLAIAAVFIVLALALLGVFNLDLARFQKNSSPTHTLLAAFMAGVLTALLAGACVAPVIAAVLLLAATLYHDGVAIALFLPLLLGMGMALPWPFAGAGLSLLPRPGAWMRFAKIPFAILILLLAANYAFVAWHGFRPATRADSIQPADFDAALSRAKGKPVFIDLWATWCKNCLLMDRTTFKNQNVRDRLNDFHVLKIQAENPSDPATAALLARLGVSGLPTFLIFEHEP